MDLVRAASANHRDSRSCAREVPDLGSRCTVELLGCVPKSAIRREADRIRRFLDADLALEYGSAF